ncbi:unnamed protein product [Ectocarpus fasciculatus]
MPLGASITLITKLSRPSGILRPHPPPVHRQQPTNRRVAITSTPHKWCRPPPSQPAILRHRHVLDCHRTLPLYLLLPVRRTAGVRRGWQEIQPVRRNCYGVLLLLRLRRRGRKIYRETEPPARTRPSHARKMTDLCSNRCRSLPLLCIMFLSLPSRSC